MCVGVCVCGLGVVCVGEGEGLPSLICLTRQVCLAPVFMYVICTSRFTTPSLTCCKMFSLSGAVSVRVSEMCKARTGEEPINFTVTTLLSSGVHLNRGAHLFGGVSL